MIKFKKELTRGRLVSNIPVLPRLDGGIGRRAGLKHPFPRGSAGSTPALGTIRIQAVRLGFFCCAKMEKVMSEVRSVPPIIDSTTRLQELVADLRGQKLIALDTEMDCYYHYYEKVCLVQLSTLEADYLLDPLVINLEPLNEIFNQPDCIAIFHAGNNDIPYLYRDHRLTFANLFDTYVAAELLELPSRGLAGLIDYYFGVEIDKKYQKADWTVRPLSPEMDRYARYDTHFLIELRQKLLPLLKERNLLGVAERQFKHILQARVHPKPFDPNNWSHLKMVRSLDKLGYAVVREIYLWREETARHYDLAPFRVLSDRMLVKIAELKPLTQQGLEEVLATSSHWPQCGRWIPQLVEVVRRGLQKGPIPLPIPPRRGQRFSEAENILFKRLRQWRNKLTKSGELNGALLTNKMLGTLVRSQPRNLEELEILGIGSPDFLRQQGTTLISFFTNA